MNNREKEITAVAAAIASGCIRCLEYHRKAALAAGLNGDELLAIAQLALMVRRNADKFNRGELDAILSENEENPAELKDYAPQSTSSCC
jgi:AhpD family alkylhydroperoxidase